MHQREEIPQQTEQHTLKRREDEHGNIIAGEQSLAELSGGIAEQQEKQGIETSGRGGVFPKGILIGTVESVQPEESGLSYYAVIKPFVSVDSVSSVSIITEYTDTAE